ncbi:MAG: 2-hydroxychromene-2-carboxylate isomerase, partial [Rhodospirillaceae bacterium]|nr:2-hydroxychromene-2-carboxylate isomerase [Rhodospirillaceae bacterium]
QPMRGAYATHDMTRMAREFGAPIVMPEVFPLHSVAASRAFYWLKGKNPEQAVAFVHRIYQAYWAQGRDMRAPEAVAAEADAMGLDGGALREALATDDAKQRLREAVDQAIERGIFGSPMFDIDGELFWGCDKFGQMDRWLKNGGW